VLSVLAFLLVFSQRFASGPLGRAFMPASELGSQVGLAMTFIGLAFAAWARFQLGGNWSSDVTVKENHTLILKGPYAIVRHPIYTGFILGMLGMALIINEVRGLLGVIVLFVAFLLKSRNEESFMRQTFGEYPQYQRRVKALIPFIY
jgi:protein-S-isoprenylcysteine O-methyltransferase Ste14